MTSRLLIPQSTYPRTATASVGVGRYSGCCRSTSRCRARIPAAGCSSSSADTGGGLLVIEQVDDVKGGPPRHVHPEQDEWFYVVEGAYTIEIGAERFDLTAGDSILAPRGVPHVWAHVGEGIGRLVIGFQPAGKMEAFFAEATELDGIPAGPMLADLFGRHGMQLLGPPLLAR